MIEINPLPRSSNDCLVANCDTNLTYQFGLSNDDIVSYYTEIFKNRTNKNKPYIDRFNSIEELEKDVYGKCRHYWLSFDFKEIYNSLDKQEFLKKINALIEKYGNAVITDDVSLCIKTDESIRLKDWYDKTNYENSEQD